MRRKVECLPSSSRYYDPLIGRFLSNDPVTTDMQLGGNFNRYWYANNNPYKNIDPDGREVKYVGSETYVAKVKADVAYGRKIEKGFAQRMLQLESSKNVHTISDAKGPDSPSNPFNSSASDGINESNGIGEGTDIYYDPYNNTQSNGYERPALAGLSHEVSHSAEADSGTKSRKIESNGQSSTENKAARAAGDMIKAIQRTPQPTAEIDEKNPKVD